MKRSAIDLGKESFVLADLSKFGETLFSKVTELNQATIITTGIDSDKKAKYKMNTIIKVVKP